MRTAFVLLMCIGFADVARAQNGYNHNWVFGHECWLKYNSSIQQWLPEYGVQLRSEEACVSMSDSAGNLLFYSEGSRVFNAQHEIMPNGDSLGASLLIAGSDTIGNSYTSGVTSILVPGESDKYYLFYKNTHEFSTPDSNLSYSIIDMTLDGGLGDVTHEDKRVYTGGLLGERVVAIKHANGRDWWLMSDYTSDSIMVQYLVTPLGVQGPYWYSLIGGFGVNGSFTVGQLITSNDGTKLASCGLVDDVWICDFDRCTGQLYNQKSHLIDSSAYPYGIAFSMDKTKLYLSMQNQHIVQVCIDDIQDTITNYTVLWSNPLPFENSSYFPGQMQLGPDGNIYTTLTIWPYSDSLQTGGIIKYLCKIAAPDSCGIACNFTQQGVYVGMGNRYARLGLPNIPNFNLGALVGSGCDTITSTNNLPSPAFTWSVYPNPFTNELQLNATGITTKAFVEIIDVLGRIVYNQTLSASNHFIHQAVDVSLLSPGVYIVSLIENNERFIRKVVKR